jgi:hypothetical protein
VGGVGTRRRDAAGHGGLTCDWRDQHGGAVVCVSRRPLVAWHALSLATLLLLLSFIIIIIILL